MKLKPIYIYVTVIIVALVTLISISSNNVEEAKSSDLITNNDNEQTLQNLEKPNRGNVNSQFIEQMKKLEESIKNNPSDTAKIKEYADMLFASHNEEKAMKYYNKILKVSSDRVDILKILAINDFNNGDYNSSRAKILKILELEPNNPETLYNMGVIESKMGNIEAAREQWENLLKFHPNSKMSEAAKLSLANIQK